MFIFFYKCDGTPGDFDALVDKAERSGNDIIYVNVHSLPGLLDDGEWNWYIEEPGFKECTCGLRDYVSNPQKAPHRHMMSLGF